MSPTVRSFSLSSVSFESKAEMIEARDPVVNEKDITPMIMMKIAKIFSEEF